MNRLATFHAADSETKNEAVEYATAQIDAGYVVVVEEVLNDAQDEVAWVVWGTLARTVFTGGWNR